MKLAFSSLEVSDLVDTGSRFDAQDPALKITVGKDKKQTSRAVDAGTAATFTETLEFELPEGTTKQEVCGAHTRVSHLVFEFCIAFIH